MLKKFALATASGAVLATGAIATPSAGAATAPTIMKPQPCKPHAAGKHWVCVKPGSYCPAAARKKIGYPAGYPKKTKQRYRCAQSKDHRWRWKRA